MAGAAVTPLDHAVLASLLDRYPALLSVDEVTRYMTAGAEGFGARNDVENAAGRSSSTA